ncbi:amino acid deaminase [Halomonas halodenitrificans]|uniref:amino acid deaminase n=1 Tax=Halomonas halodenitrificans TaxID=28252 RepID=UPI000488FA19|nr:amino acid deaminase [Halomonas halodenitrificans]
MREVEPYCDKGLVETGSTLLTGVSLPAAVIHEAPLAHNLAWMQRFAEAHGARLAPHGKTTMSPALFRRQLDAGAWGITLATAPQCRAAFAHGVTRLLMANQLVGEANMAMVAKLIQAGAEFYCVVDGKDNVDQLGHFFADRGLRLNVLIELGVPGGRCGCRNIAQVEALAAAIADQPALRLVGIEGYEGMIAGGDEVAAVRAYGDRLVETVKLLHGSGVLASAAPIVTAAGSRWFDLIAQAFDEAELHERYTPVLRPGCYVVHDHRLYADAMAEVKARDPHLQGELQPALEVFAHVQSLPEPGLAIVALGKRDIGHEPDMPLPLRHYPRDTLATVGGAAVAPGSWRTTHIMDQHLFLEIPEEAELAVGDAIAFGTSHPCLTFDKWRHLLLVDEALTVTESVATCF